MFSYLHRGEVNHALHLRFLSLLFWYGSVCVMVPQEHWEKAWKITSWLRDSLLSPERIDQKTLKTHRGLLIYLAILTQQLLPTARAFTSPLFLWPWQKDDAWKMFHKEIVATLAQQGSPPDFVRAALEPAPHVTDLATLFSSLTPPMWHVPRHILYLLMASVTLLV